MYKKCVKKCHNIKENDSFFSDVWKKQQKTEEREKKTRFLIQILLLYASEQCEGPKKKKPYAQSDCYLFGSKAGNDSTNAYAAVRVCVLMNALVFHRSLHFSRFPSLCLCVYFQFFFFIPLMRMLLWFTSTKNELEPERISIHNKCIPKKVQFKCQLG